MAGFSDVEQRLCLGLALWNGNDAILKERMFGLTGAQGNHGEDPKDYWWYLDSVPSHAWNRWRYHYPQARVPVPGARRGERPARQARPRVRTARHRRVRRRPLLGGRGRLRQGRRRRHRDGRPGDQRRPGRGDPACAPDGLVPQHLELGGRRGQADARSARRRRGGDRSSDRRDRWSWSPSPAPTAPIPIALFCDNETNDRRVFGSESGTAYPKDGINDHVVSGAPTVNPDHTGTKVVAVVPTRRGGRCDRRSPPPAAAGRCCRDRPRRDHRAAPR